MNSSETLAGYYWIYVDHLQTRSTQRALSRIHREARLSPAVGLTNRLLTAIVVVETHERPAAIRAVERLLQVAGRNRTTCGPLQLRNAPWHTNAAIRIAAQRLAEFVDGRGNIDWAQAAICWHGPSTDHALGRLTYANALRMADRAIAFSQTALKAGRCADGDTVRPPRGLVIPPRTTRADGT